MGVITLEPGTTIITKIDTREDTGNDDAYKLIIHNDDYNTFDHVIDCLMEFCGIEKLPANQIANIVHYKGSCPAKSGSRSAMEELKGKFVGAGIIASVD